MSTNETTIWVIVRTCFINVIIPYLKIQYPTEAMIEIIKEKAMKAKMPESDMPGIVNQ